MKWLVEFEGQKKDLDEIADQDFQAAVAPFRQHVATSLAGAENELHGLSVVFFVDPDEGLKFRLAGPPAEVNLAVDLIGPSAELSPCRH